MATIQSISPPLATAVPVMEQTLKEVRNVNIRGVPQPVWQEARQQALAANRPFKVWMVDLLAGCQPRQRMYHRPLPSPSTSRSINVRHVPVEIWLRAKTNAIASGLSLREYVIDLLATNRSSDLDNSEMTLPQAPAQ